MIKLMITNILFDGNIKTKTLKMFNGMEDIKFNIGDVGFSNTLKQPNINNQNNAVNSDMGMGLIDFDFDFDDSEESEQDEFIKDKIINQRLDDVWQKRTTQKISDKFEKSFFQKFKTMDNKYDSLEKRIFELEKKTSNDFYHQLKNNHEQRKDKKQMDDDKLQKELDDFYKMDDDDDLFPKNQTKKPNFQKQENNNEIDDLFGNTNEDLKIEKNNNFFNKKDKSVNEIDDLFGDQDDDLMSTESYDSPKNKNIVKKSTLIPKKINFSNLQNDQKTNKVIVPPKINKINFEKPIHLNVKVPNKPSPSDEKLKTFAEKMKNRKQQIQKNKQDSQEHNIDLLGEKLKESFSKKNNPIINEQSKIDHESQKKIDKLLDILSRNKKTKQQNDHWENIVDPGEIEI